MTAGSQGIGVDELGRPVRCRGDSCNGVGVGVMEGDRLGAVGLGVHDAGSEQVKGAAKENIVCGGADDMELEVDWDGAEPNRDILRQTEGIVTRAVRALHLEDNARVIREAKVVADTL